MAVKFKAKPLVIEAIQWVGEENCAEVFEFLGWDHPEDEEDHSAIFIPVYPNGVLEHISDWSVLNDMVEVVPGSWLTKDGQGNMRAYTDGVFRNTFEELPGETRTEVFVNGVDCRVKVVDLASGETVELHGGYAEQAKLVEQAKQHLRERLEKGE